MGMAIALGAPEPGGERFHFAPPGVLEPVERGRFHGTGHFVGFTESPDADRRLDSLMDRVNRRGVFLGLLRHGAGAAALPAVAEGLMN